MFSTYFTRKQLEVLAVATIDEIFHSAKYKIKFIYKFDITLFDAMAHEYKIEELAEVLQVLANPIRLKMLSLIAVKPRHAYELSKLLGLSYPLTHLHVSLLERTGFIKGEIVPGPRPKKVYSLTEFKIVVSPDLLKRMGEKLEAE
ncbi:hypothetical protein MA03_05415 [Infirmifilum uzonense]|uniref:HTH arsR-type domain-containing protein n=2 Tax=Thermofilaceae TaxID=114378 RepID=A0A0F7FJ15_9CREN|nr:hypothetical protein MA03_05415 [Infirmifilum uzonense]